jgi:hypothetical protein
MSKTIQINPSLFNVGGSLSKTKKNQEKKQKPISSFITPNILKNKLLKRIKEHKKEELKDFNDKKNTISDIGIYTDEFNDSIEYLKSLSNVKKNQENIQKKTIKNHQSLNHIHNIQIELPDILKEEIIPFEGIKMESPTIILNQTTQPQETPFEGIKMESPTIILNKKTQPEDPPFGCLKGGKKPTYRLWNKTQKNPNLSLNIKYTENIERDKRLNALKEKIKMKQQEKFNDNIVMNNNLIQLQSDSKEIILPESNLTLENNIIEQNIEPSSTRRLIKKTIHRKYTLGKSKIHNKIGILVTDRNTRKNILNAQRELRKKPINDVKVYLREHSLMKAGSNAPNDVVRKIYESAVLSGEITNNNKDILLHNFLKEKDE